MIKNLKLRTKLFGGFTIVLILLVIISIVSFTALNETSDGTNKGEEVNRIVIDILQARQEEKNYIIRQDENTLAQVNGFIRGVEERARKAKTQDERAAAREEMEAVITSANQYAKAFQTYVQLEAQKDETLAAMQETAGQALEKVEGVRADQDKLLIDTIEKANAMVADKMDIFNDAGKILKVVMEIRLVEQRFILRNRKKDKDKILGLIEQAKEISSDLQNRFTNEDDKLLAEQMMAAADGYVFGFTDYAASIKKRVATENQISEYAGNVESAAQAIIDSQRKRMAELQADPDAAKEELAGIFENIDQANLAIGWLWEARVSEKNYVKKAEEAFKEEIDDLTGKIVAAAKEMQADLSDPENKARAGKMSESIEGYIGKFTEYADMVEIAAGDAQMLASYAVSLEVTATSIQAAQKEEVGRIQVESREMVKESLAKAEEANSIKNLFLDTRMSEKNFVISGGAGEWREKVEQQTSDVLARAEALKERLKDEQHLQQVDEAMAAIRSYGADFKEYVDFIGRQARADDEMVAAARRAQEAAEMSKTDQYSRMTKQMGAVKTILWIVAPLAIFLGLLLAYFITRGISRNVSKAMKLAEMVKLGDLTYRLNLNQKDEIGQLAESLDTMAGGLETKADLANQIASGDLTAEAELASEKDTLGQALQIMIASLNEVLDEINKAVAQVTSGSGQVSDASQALSQGATEQAASLEEITSTMTELGSRTKTNAENAAQANQLSLTAREAAEKGNTQMQEMVGAMDSINASSKEIAKIIKAIDDIAFQTNLLALNAAVEAARAGVHGKGFAVVAQEVRNLAGRSAKAAQETSELIENSVKKVENGNTILDRTAAALAEIVDGTTKVADLVGEIAAASNEQAQGITQVNQGLTQVEQVTQQNTASAEQTASAAEQLSSQAAFLQQLLTRFKLKKSAYLALDEGPVQEKESDWESDESWGGNEEKPSTRDQRVEPQDIIALDDDEFGKY